MDSLAEFTQQAQLSSEPGVQLHFYGRARHRKSLSRKINQFLATDMKSRDRLEGGCAKRLSMGTAFEKLDQHLIAVKLHELAGDEALSKLALQNRGVVVAEAERDECSDVAKNGLPDGQGKLVYVLVG